MVELPGPEGGTFNGPSTVMTVRYCELDKNRATPATVHAILGCAVQGKNLSSVHTTMPKKEGQRECKYLRHGEDLQAH